jgi:hypothetical protein
MIWRPRFVFGFTGDETTLDLSLPQYFWEPEEGVSLGESAIAVNGAPFARWIRYDQACNIKIRFTEDEYEDVMDMLQWLVGHKQLPFVFRFEQDWEDTEYTLTLEKPTANESLGPRRDAMAPWVWEIDLTVRALERIHEPLFQAPSVPVALAAEDVEPESFWAVWESAARASSYLLDVATDEDFVSFVPGYEGLSVHALTALVDGLDPLVEYFYRVRATNPTGTTIPSNVISVTTLSDFEALGGVITIDGEYTVHTFLASGNFTVTRGTRSASRLLVGGGGAGGGSNQGGTGGGGGSGGEVKEVAARDITVGVHAVGVGGGAVGVQSPPGSDAGTDGGTSTFDGDSAVGGGGGGHGVGGGGAGSGRAGAYGGGGAHTAFFGGGGNGGVGTKGHSGGPGTGSGGGVRRGGGGGGASEDGHAGFSGASNLGTGGAGALSSISGAATRYGGGGGGASTGTAGAGGAGGGGAGGSSGGGHPVGFPGTDGLGGGGGGSQDGNAGGDAGDGVVVIRYKTLP